MLGNIFLIGNTMCMGLYIVIQNKAFFNKQGMCVCMYVYACMNVCVLNNMDSLAICNSRLATYTTPHLLMVECHWPFIPT